MYIIIAHEGCNFWCVWHEPMEFDVGIRWVLELSFLLSMENRYFPLRVEGECM